ncbi:MAG TPA: exodeoxyribonuclease VII large subunit [Desulfomonilia bacterium]|nr:exodeoxyribonuclease VII large subunit [Desulfomonilia bacterium]
MNCLHVSELNERAREILSSALGPDLWVVGEIHGLKHHAKSGHVYFDLVEKAAGGSDQYIAKVSCAFFRGSIAAWQRSLAALGLNSFEIANGIEVKLRARVDLFVKEGRYQLIISEIDPSYTYGAIARRRAQTIETLRAEGLMEKNKALAIPAAPLNIGLVTSRGSAAYQDFTSIIMKSGYAFRITLFDAHMQGETTVREVTKAIKALEKETGVDTIVIIRGGGAKTDLFVFDDITICRAIAGCSKPVITGIGHEIDLSVADMVAHAYFVTPTDAARYYVSRAGDIWSFLEAASASVNLASRGILDKSLQHLDMVSSRFAYLTQRHISHVRTTLESTSSALLRRGFNLISTHDRRLMNALAAFTHQAMSCMHTQASLLDRSVVEITLNTTSLIKHLNAELEHRHTLMLREIEGGIAESLKTLDRYEKDLCLMRPSLTLKRGYSITLGPDGKVLRDSNDAARDDRIISMLMIGKIHSVVYDKEP